MTSPNIIWICSDQQRSDSLGCAGNPVARTPNLDAIAAAGTRFSRHITPMQICSPSRATLFTGRYPRHHQLITNGMALDPETTTLAGLLAAAGYRTHSVGKQHLQPLLAPAELRMPDSRAFWKLEESEDWRGPYYGFQTLDLLLGEADTATLAGHYARWLRREHPEAVDLLQAANAPEAPPADLDEVWRAAIPPELHYNSWITDRAVDFIAGQEAPFFLFVSYPDPHHPFSPPAAYADRFAPADMPLPRVDPGELDKMPAYYRELYPTGGGFRENYWAARRDQEAGAMMATSEISEATLRRAIAHTYAMIEMIDDGVGRILETLAAQGLEEDTIVLFTSDHGELLGSHGLLHKGPPPYRQLVEVALLMKGPGIQAGGTCDALTSHIDLTPTFLELAGLSGTGHGFDGQSLTPLLQGQDGWRRDAAFGEYHPTARPELYNQTIRTDRWRLTLYPKQPELGELFDHEADPAEHENLFHMAAADGVRRDLAARLAAEFPPQPTVDNVALCKW